MAEFEEEEEEDETEELREKRGGECGGGKAAIYGGVREDRERVVMTVEL